MSFHSNKDILSQVIPKKKKDNLSQNTNFIIIQLITDIIHKKIEKKLIGLISPRRDVSIS